MDNCRFLFVIVSKDNSFKLNSDSLNQAKAKHQIDLVAIDNNRRSLAEVYNDLLKKERVEKNHDFIGFLHSDVNLDVSSLCNHLVECNQKYDVFGLCGTSILNVSQSPLNWWTGSNPTPKAKWGCVTHGELGNKTSFFNGDDRANITNHEVACIDGLCIIFGKKAIESDIEFDPLFSFDFYDTDISLQAVMRYNLKLGVIVEKSLQHYSVGRSILTPDFLKHELDFRRKWNLEIPSGSALAKMIGKN